ncbi:hypothetical protein ACS0TY_020004 [Phlomoides rotata]
MDPGKAMASGVTVIGPGAPSTYHVAPRVENSDLGTSQMTPPMMSVGSEKKKRGRPRKYKPDEASNKVVSSVQVSSSAPPASGQAYAENVKQSAARPINSEKKHKSKIGTEKLDEWVECSTGSSFLPHVITVNTGEDILTKIMEFSRQGPRAVCIISGSGTVSNVTIRHPNSSGGILTYEGLFEILSFTGSFTPTETPDKYGRPSGMITITLSGADGRVVGGLVSGLTLAATQVKVVVASFLLGSPNELKHKKQLTPNATGEDAPPSSDAQGGPPNCSSPNNWAAVQAAEKTRKPSADINISLQG